MREEQERRVTEYVRRTHPELLTEFFRAFGAGQYNDYRFVEWLERHEPWALEEAVKEVGRDEL